MNPQNQLLKNAGARDSTARTFLRSQGRRTATPATVSKLQLVNRTPRAQCRASGAQGGVAAFPLVGGIRSPFRLGLGRESQSKKPVKASQSGSNQLANYHIAKTRRITSPTTSYAFAPDFQSNPVKVGQTTFSEGGHGRAVPRHFPLQNLHSALDPWHICIVAVTEPHNIHLSLGAMDGWRAGFEMLSAVGGFSPVCESPDGAFVMSKTTPANISPSQESPGFAAAIPRFSGPAIIVIDGHRKVAATSGHLARILGLPEALSPGSSPEGLPAPTRKARRASARIRRGNVRCGN